MKPLSTTLNAIREHSPCADGWAKLLATLGKTKADDEPVLFETILDSNGLDDALWCLRTLDHSHQRTCRLFGVWCARQVQHLMTDPRSISALDFAENHANGTATDSELAAARAAARAAAWAAARAAALDFAENHANGTATDSELAAAWAAAWDAAWDAARAAQAEKFRQVCRAGQWVD